MVTYHLPSPEQAPAGRARVIQRFETPASMPSRFTSALATASPPNTASRSTIGCPTTRPARNWAHV